MTRLIDADALHDDLRAKQKWIVKRDDKHNEGYTYDQVHFAIDEQPTVDAVPVRHGHWVGIDDEPHEVWECDVCGYIYETDSRLHNYCPQCGADMKGENNE